MNGCYVLPVRIDCLQRRRNLERVIRWLGRFDSLRVILVEQDVDRHLDPGTLPGTVTYVFDRLDGPFNKGRAMNIGFAHGDEDVIAFGDADMVMPPVLLARAAALCERGVVAVDPYRHVLDLSESRTESLDPANLPDPEALKGDAHGGRAGETPGFAGGVFLVRREFFLQVGGMDEQFAGWGGEDDAMSLKIRRFTDDALSARDGCAFHLWHPRRGPDDPAYPDNRARLFALQALDDAAFTARCDADRRVLAARLRTGRTAPLPAAVQGPARAPTLCYVSMLERGGYGYAAVGNLRALHDTGLQLCWSPCLPRPTGGDRHLSAAILAPLARRAFPDEPSITALVGDCAGAPVRLLHTIPERWPSMVSAGARHLGYAAWETDALPAHWRAPLRAVEHLLVPTTFNSHLFARDTGLPVTVVPHACRRHAVPAGAADIDDFNRRYAIDPGHIVFYSINSWIPRKAWWDVINAFLLAFDANDPVTLVAKTSKAGPDDFSAAHLVPTRRLVEAIRAHYPDPARIVLIDREVDGREIDRLHARGDVYVSLARAEGWGIGMFDAARFARPVIATGWGGPLDYLREEWCTLLDYRLEPVIENPQYRSYAAPQHWARADIDAAIAAMRNHVDDPEPYRRNARLLSDWIGTHFSESVVAGRLMEAIGD